MGPNSPIDQSTIGGDATPPKAPQPSAEEKLIAKAGNSPEWKFIKDYLQNRIEYHRAFLPAAEVGKDGAVSISVANSKMTNEQLGEKWKVACLVIGEIEGLISQVETITNAAKTRRILR